MGFIPKLVIRIGGLDAIIGTSKNNGYIRVLGR
jgi:hypothetical protein